MVMIMPKTKNTVAVNKVQQWCKKNGVDRQSFISMYFAAGLTLHGKHLSPDTITKIYNGETGINLETAIHVAQAIGASSVSDLFDFE